MRLIHVMAFVVALGSAAATLDAQQAKTRSSVLDVAGMSCSICAKTVEKAALKFPGVKAITVNQPAGTAAIEYAPEQTTADAIAKAITKKTGFEAKPQGPKK